MTVLQFLAGRSDGQDGGVSPQNGVCVLQPQVRVPVETEVLQMFLFFCNYFELKLYHGFSR